MDKNVAFLRVARGIRKMENMLDEVLAEAATLQADVSQARLVLDLSALSTQRAIARLAVLQQNIVAARSKMAGAHADLAKAVAKRRDIPLTCSPGCTGGSLDEVQMAAAA